MSKVSVVVPVYNVEKYLEKCLLSIINQTYQVFEIILIDDGSTDASSNICDKFEVDYDIVKVIHTENQGVSSARNIGIEKAKGDYILFVDSDDYIDSDMIETLINVEQNKNVDLVLCGYYRETSEGSIAFLPKEIECRKFEELDKVLAYWGFDPIIGSPCNKLFKNDVLKKYKIRYLEGMIYGEDYTFCMRYMTHMKTYCFINTAKYHYNDTPNSLTKRNSVDAEQLWRDQLIACKSLFQLIKANNFKITVSESARQAYSYICSLNFYRHICSVGLLKSLVWARNNISNSGYCKLIKKTNNLYRMKKLNWLFKILKCYV